MFGKYALLLHHFRMCNAFSSSFACVVSVLVPTAASWILLLLLLQVYQVKTQNSVARPGKGFSQCYSQWFLCCHYPLPPY